MKHFHLTSALEAACPVCNPGKTVPQLNDAYRTSKEQTLLALLKRAQRFIYSGPLRNSSHDPESVLSADIRAALESPAVETSLPLDVIKVLQEIKLFIDSPTSDTDDMIHVRRLVVAAMAKYRLAVELT